jgi:hypothetical protein
MTFSTQYALDYVLPYQSQKRVTQKEMLNHSQPTCVHCGKPECMVYGCFNIDSKSGFSKKSPSLCCRNQWLAGLIDGDGCFYINKTTLQISFEITVASDDQHLLQEVQQMIGGILKPRAGSESVRLRIFRKPLLINLVFRINGHIRHKARMSQLKHVCELLNLPYLMPIPLTSYSSYISGLFDAYGSVTLTVNKSSSVSSQLKHNYGKAIRLIQSKSNHQLSVHIVSKNRDLITQVHQALGFGKVIVETASLNNRRPNALYRWYFRSQDDVQCWLDYVQKNPLISKKKIRILLLPRYFKLKLEKQHLKNNNASLMWQTFCHEWFGCSL